VDPSGRTVQLSTEPPENFVRPAADPMFRSVAAAFGARAIAIVLSGMGRDASIGAKAIRDAGGKVFVQDPNLAVAASMPRSVVSLGLADEILPLDALAQRINAEAGEIAAQPV